ncbi:hypothetical protein BB559_002084 [Furculomyces boomerangus]|uniref:G-patch domain-containing protein n=2 Tax=Harpellales TaxID=61421 RepID=A0A2T9YYE7_9FUNG|nr:hypothetical protein BB559_002084 [Furculomyces boomerangus]
MSISISQTQPVIFGIDDSNKGFQLLMKTGWKYGTGLGKSEQGRKFPIKVYKKVNKSGIGADTKNPLETKNKIVKDLGGKQIRLMQEKDERIRQHLFQILK